MMVKMQCSYHRPMIMVVMVMMRWWWWWWWWDVGGDGMRIWPSPVRIWPPSTVSSWDLYRGARGHWNPLQFLSDPLRAINIDCKFWPLHKSWKCFWFLKGQMGNVCKPLHPGSVLRLSFHMWFTFLEDAPKIKCQVGKGSFGRIRWLNSLTRGWLTSN